jgi:rifampicin phosphotransferase
MAADIDHRDPTHSLSDPESHWTTANLGEAMPGVLTPLNWTFYDFAVNQGGRDAGYHAGAYSAAERRNMLIAQPFYGRAAFRIEPFAMLGDRLPGTNSRDAVEAYFGSVPGLEYRPTIRRYPLVALRLPTTFATTLRRLRRMVPTYDGWWWPAMKGVDKQNLCDARRSFLAAKGRFEIALSEQAVTSLIGVQPAYDMLARLISSIGAGDLARLSAPSGGVEMDVVRDIWRAGRGEITIEDVVRQHGFHGPAEGEISSSVWCDDDTPLRHMISQYRDLGEDEDPRRRETLRNAERACLEQELLEAATLRQRPAVHLALKLVRSRVPLRGVAKRSLLQAMAVARAATRRIGVLLTDLGQIDQPDDAFYLTVAELMQVPCNVTDLVGWRRARREQHSRIRLPPNWTGNPQPTTESQPPSASVVCGTPASPGIATGQARVLTSLDFAEVEPGEILVAPTTDPSWCSIMFVSKALVVDIGSFLSHAAIVARELDIPCVVGAADATSQIRTGDLIRVDGNLGQVHILRQSAGEVAERHA